jgi:hypothetical protein
LVRQAVCAPRGRAGAWCRDRQTFGRQGSLRRSRSIHGGPVGRTEGFLDERGRHVRRQRGPGARLRRHGDSGGDRPRPQHNQSRHPGTSLRTHRHSRSGAPSWWRPQERCGASAWLAGGACVADRGRHSRRPLLAVALGQRSLRHLVKALAAQGFKVSQQVGNEPAARAEIQLSGQRQDPRGWQPPGPRWDAGRTNHRGGPSAFGRIAP